MSKEPKGNVSPESVGERLEQVVSDVNRVLGLQGLQVGDGGAVPQAGGSTLSIGCSTYSLGCGTTATVTIR
ncbi:hypothetical protein ACFCYX_33410 [Streptomyces populi]|uniref:hypothetical protein n=1 Tax=Streptomyces populi TaxID=2058924 RepID=UPI0013A69722|nr:hypothetical protein [Streptomyces populi]